MEYKTFQNQIIAALKQQMGEEVEIQTKTIPKLNGIEKEALLISKKGDLVAPTIYLEQLYDAYLHGISAAELVEKISGQYQRLKTKTQGEKDARFFTEWERAAPQIYCQLVQAKRNDELLAEVPHRKILDLAILYYYQIRQEKLPNGTIQIHREHLNIWGISEEELFEQAWKNTLRDLPARTENLQGYLREEYGVSFPEVELGAFGEQLYLVSNRRGCLGAICICYPDLLKNLAQRLEANLYVIPSSIHECMVVPDYDTFTESELSCMVREVNRDLVEPQEILSDHVYYYRRDTEKLEFASAD